MSQNKLIIHIKYIYKLEIPNEFSNGSLSKVLPKPNFNVSLVCGNDTSITDVNLPSGYLLPHTDIPFLTLE